MTARRAQQGALPGLAVAGAVLMAVCCRAASGLDIVNYLSPRNRERPSRASTEFIVLHTTEGTKRGSLQKIYANGEAHYFIDAAGRVYRIIDRRRVALHAGRSMWNGKTDLDPCSLGVEMEGYHNRDITGAQYRSLAALVADLQRRYGVPDERVLCHSMVAYGAPNRWHRKSHRGRKRCGMLFAKPSVRARLGLEGRPACDPDVRAGRLVVGDAYLAGVLYDRGQAVAKAAAPAPPAPAAEPARASPPPESNVIAANLSAWDIARDQFDSPATTYVFPDGRRRRGTEIRDWGKMPIGTRVLVGSQRENQVERVLQIGRDGATAADLAGDEAGAATTLYVLPDGRVSTGAELSSGGFPGLPDGTRMLVGYTQGGQITARRSAFDVCGPKWRAPSTFFLFPDGAIRPGSVVSEKQIPAGSRVFYRN